MDNGAQAAEMITRVVIMGSTFILGLGGKVALSVARFAAAAMDPNAKQSGKLRLKTLLQSGSELKVFTLQGEANYQRFAKEAKDYGILYSVVKRTDEDVQGRSCGAVDGGYAGRVPLPGWGAPSRCEAVVAMASPPLRDGETPSLHRW